MFKQIPSLSLFGALPLLCSAFVTFAAATDFPMGTFAGQALGITLTFDDKGHLHVNKGGVTEVEADYAVTGDKVKVTDKSGPWACTKDGQQTGTYRWRFENGMLTLSKIADPCDDRSGDLTKEKWKMQK